MIVDVLFIYARLFINILYAIENILYVIKDNYVFKKIKSKFK